MDKISGIRLSDVNVLTKNGGEIRIGISKKRADSKSLIMGTLTLQNGERLRSHVHDYGEEAIFVLKGKASLVVEHKTCTLEPGFMYLVPKKSRHSIENDGEETLELVFATAPLAPCEEAGDRVCESGMEIPRGEKT